MTTQGRDWASQKQTACPPVHFICVVQWGRTVFCKLKQKKHSSSSQSICVAPCIVVDLIDIDE